MKYIVVLRDCEFFIGWSIPTTYLSYIFPENCTEFPHFVQKIWRFFRLFFCIFWYFAVAEKLMTSVSIWQTMSSFFYFQLCVCVCVCVFTSIHLEGFICLGLEVQGTDQRCCVEDVIFLCQVPSSILQYEPPSLSN